MRQSTRAIKARGDIASSHSGVSAVDDALGKPQVIRNIITKCSVSALHKEEIIWVLNTRIKGFRVNVELSAIPRISFAYCRVKLIDSKKSAAGQVDYLEVKTLREHDFVAWRLVGGKQ